MNTERDEIYDLIAKSFTDELTEEESDILNVWKAAKKANLKAYNDFIEIWKQSSRLSMPSQIDLPYSLEITRKKAGISKRPIRWMPIFTQIAAVLILSLLLSGVYNMFLVSKAPEKTESVVYQNIKATYGTQSRVELPDGTVVFLNSGSSLRFPNSFNGMKTRSVELAGEGNFSVAKKSEQPFIVGIEQIQVRVLGTKFNVDAYPDNESITIALIEGSIELQQRTGEKAIDMMEMKPNQVAYYKQSDNKLTWESNSDLRKYSAWIDGKIVFYNDPVKTVIHKLKNWYNVDIELADKNLENYRFTGTFINEPLEQVLNILNLTSRMKYRVIPSVKLGDNSFSKRKIILKSK
jgi:ferric-dicitrate binding protein FerR (iron transport regulator)